MDLQPTSQQSLQTASPWRVVGASVQGTSHIHRGQPCQDAHGYCSLSGGGLVAVVADGAGSAKRSEQGAQTAVQAVMRAAEEAALSGLAQETDMTPHAWEVLMLWIFQRARQAVLHLARAQHHAQRDYAATLSVAVVAAGWLAVGQIGDGAVVALNAQGELRTVTRLQKGEYANETHFLTQRDALSRVQVYSSPQPLKALAVMSDGLVRLALNLPSGDPFSPFFQPLFRFSQSLQQENETEAGEQLASFLSSDRVNSRTDDDKSLVLAAYTAGTALTAPAPRAVQTIQARESA